MNKHARRIIAATLLACIHVLGTIHAQTPPKEAAANPKAPRQRLDPAYQQRSFPGPDGTELKYGWLLPSNPKAGEKYPLVICLHGSGGNVKASSVLSQAKMREQYPTFVMVPEAGRGFSWATTDVIKRRGAAAANPERMPALLDALRSLLKTEAIDPARVYITGQSLGGVGSWGAIARNPELFAAAVPVCGAWRVEDTSKMVTVPVWAFHGENDATVPVQFSRDLTAALTKAGGTAKYTEYPGVGHDSWLKAYDDQEMWQWLFSQRKTTTSK